MHTAPASFPTLHCESKWQELLGHTHPGSYPVIALARGFWENWAPVCEAKCCEMLLLWHKGWMDFSQKWIHAAIRGKAIKSRFPWQTPLNPLEINREYLGRRGPAAQSKSTILKFLFLFLFHPCEGHCLSQEKKQHTSSEFMRIERRVFFKAPKPTFKWNWKSRKWKNVLTWSASFQKIFSFSLETWW